MRAKRCDGTNRSDREQGQPNEWRRRYSLQSRSGPCSRTPSGPAVHADCINRPDRRLHPTHHLIITLCLQRGSHPQTPFAYPPIIGHWASSWHRPKADMPSQPASLRDVRTGDGSRRSRGLAGRVRRPPRRRHLSPTVCAASRPRAAGPRAGGAIRNVRPGRSPSRWKSSAPYSRSA